MVGLEGPPLFPVTVCPTESIFVQTTVSPFLTVIDAGLKAKFWIVTLCVTGVGVGVGVGVGARGGVVTGAGDGLVVGAGVGVGVGVGDGDGFVTGAATGAGAGGLVVPYGNVLLAPF